MMPSTSPSPRPTSTSPATVPWTAAIMWVAISSPRRPSRRSLSPRSRSAISLPRRNRKNSVSNVKKNRMMRCTTKPAYSRADPLSARVPSRPSSASTVAGSPRLVCHQAAAEGPISGNSSSQNGVVIPCSRASWMKRMTKCASCASAMPSSTTGTMKMTPTAKVSTLGAISGGSRSPSNAASRRLSGHSAIANTVAQASASRKPCRTHSPAAKRAAITTTCAIRCDTGDGCGGSGIRSVTSVLRLISGKSSRAARCRHALMLNARVPAWWQKPSGGLWTPKAGSSSAADRAFGVDVDGVERLARRHEQPVSLDPAEAQIGAAFGQGDAADHLAVRGDYDHSVQPLAGAPAAPQIAMDIAAEAVRRAVADIGERASIGEPGAVIGDVIDADCPRPGARLDDVHAGLVGRKAEPVRAVDVAGDDAGAAGAAVDPVDIGRQFRLGLAALVIRQDAERRIGEPDRSVRFDHDIVGRVERLAVDPVETVADHGDRAVVLGPRHLAPAVLAGDEAPLPVAGVAVGVVRWLAKDADRAGLLVPAQDAVVRDVAPQQAALVAEPHRALAPAASGIEPLDGGVERRPDRLEARIEGDDRRIGVGLRRLPGTGHRGSSLMWLV